MPRQKSKGNKTEHIRIDIREEDELHKILYAVKRERGLTQNTELIRLLLKEEHERRKPKQPVNLDEPIFKEAEKLIKEHPEYGYKDMGEFIRASVRAHMLSSANDESKRQQPH